MAEKAVLIAVSGGSGSGKSFLTNQLAPLLGPRNAIIHLDHFYKDLGQMPPDERKLVNFDCPDALDWKSIHSTLDACRLKKPVSLPDYDFATHTRTTKTTILPPCDWYLIDGLWCWWPSSLSDCYDHRIFIDLPDNDRLKRRMTRDVAERGRTPQSVQEQWERQAFPMHGQFVQPQILTADRVLSGHLTSEQIRALAHELRDQYAG